MSSWIAAATSYAHHGEPMLPLYIYYSMFGFQRVGDQIWAAADQRARGFLLGATSGRTTLSGEGLQHQDGTSHLVAATIPNCKAYDPAFACELAVILDHGMREMMVAQRDVFYYVTMMNENYAQPDLRPGSEADIIRGCYKISSSLHPYSLEKTPKTPSKLAQKVTLLGSGAILTEVLKAAAQLEAMAIDVTVFSVTSWSELARDGITCQQPLSVRPELVEGSSGAAQDRRRQAQPERCVPFITQQLTDSEGPLIAATDYVRAVPESIRAYLPEGRSYTTLGTDGFGRSDTRAALRAFFNVDAASIVKAALHQLSY
jgi:pyruvate dehydrogenase E1 component